MKRPAAKLGFRPGPSMAFAGVLALLALFLRIPSAAGPDQQKAAPGPLSRAHSSLEGAANCQKCHGQDNAIVAERCLSCHAPVAARIAAKKGVHREVTGDCQVCHVEHQGVDVDIRPLDPKSFDHRSETGFPLEGKHAAVAKNCPACHKTRSYMTNRRNCDFCHADPHKGGMTQSCESCHTTQGWNFASRAFHKTGLFPLEGRHLSVPCASCHLDGLIKGTPTRCYDCHWIRRQDDPYRTRLGNECEECHRPTSWTAVLFDHGTRTGMPLNGAHRNLNCDACHKGGVFTNASFDCYACHREDYEGTNDPNHLRAGFPTMCELCHLPSQTSWDQASFNHASIFPLQGVHATLACSSCHKNNIYAGTPRDCYGCHRADYESAKDPNHVTAGFPTTCDTCHRPTDASFEQASFNHAAIFPLQGVHATLACSSCHKNNVYAGTPRDCYGCHRADYESAKDPNHVAAGFPTTCDSCHRPTDASFEQASFNHAAIFLLQGVHATLACSSCHKNNVYAGTPRDCYGCHRADYESAKDPNHVTAGFPTTCDTCHRPTDASFEQASFNHAAIFPLQGVHATLACSSCHKNNVYAGTPRDCYGCHRADYESAKDPNHIAAGFPTTCDSCHRPTDTSFTQGRFDHTYFPITSGRHAGNACSACHPDSSNFKVFNCLTCHGRSETDSHHTGVSGYSYNSQACYSCHPQGRT